AVENVVAEGQGYPVAADESPADDERLGQALRARLRRVFDGEAEMRSVAEQPLESVLVLRGRDDQNPRDAREHQGGEGIVDHRLVVDRDQLCTDGVGERVAAGSG